MTTDPDRQDRYRELAERHAREREDLRVRQARERLESGLYEESDGMHVPLVAGAPLIILGPGHVLGDIPASGSINLVAPELMEPLVEKFRDSAERIIRQAELDEEREAEMDAWAAAGASPPDPEHVAVHDVPVKPEEVDPDDTQGWLTERKPDVED